MNVFGAKTSTPSAQTNGQNHSLTWTTEKPSCPSASWPVFKADRVGLPVYNGQCTGLRAAHGF